jgi:hypothetical protein
MKKKYLSILIFCLGFFTQLVFIVVLGSLAYQQKISEDMDRVLGGISIFIYLIAIPGVYVGAKFLKEEGRVSLASVLGIICNILWFLLITAGLIAVGVFGISA